jgi:multidrug efflux pump subunit AcrA (membrane-fusion protein)
VKSGVVEPVVVELGLSDSRFVEVRQGLSEQDQVIMQGKDLVKPKQKVRTVPATGQ